MKKLLGLSVAFLTSFFLLYALVSKDRPAKHASLGTAALPPLIAVHDLYAASSSLPLAQAEPETRSAIRSDIGWQPQYGNRSGLASRLALPGTGADPGPLPMVVVIEGRTASGMSTDKMRTERFLTNRGYAVLSIECRRLSSIAPAPGPGAPRDAARSPFCSADSIRDEVLARVEQGIADPHAVAVLGSGSGAHMALMTMVLEPDLFKAAILHSALFKNPRPASRSRPVASPLMAVMTPWKDENDGSTDAMPFIRTSPFDLARSIHGALLITHGKADEVVPVEHAQALARALRRAGKDVEAVYFNHEGHLYNRWQTRVQTARLSEAFLARHLGGRSGGYDFIELLAKLL